MNPPLVYKVPTSPVYAEHLLGAKKVSYDEICRELFRQIERLQDGESVVLKTVGALK